MYLVYLGESGNTGTSLKDPNQPHHVYAGLMVHEDRWNGIKAAFSQVCGRHLGRDLGEEGAPREIRASQILQGRGPFTSWPMTKRLDMVDDFINILVWQETPLLVSYVDKHEMESADPREPGREPRWRGPWEAVFSRFVFYLDLYMDELNLARMPPEHMAGGEPVRVTERVAIIADGGSHMNHQFMQQLLKTEMDLPTGAVLENVHFVRSRDSHCTQLANLCAYFVRRNLQQPDRPNPQYSALEKGHVLQVLYQVQM